VNLSLRDLNRIKPDCPRFKDVNEYHLLMASAFLLLFRSWNLVFGSQDVRRACINCST